MGRRKTSVMIAGKTRSGKTAIQKDGKTQKAKSITTNGNGSQVKPCHLNDIAVCYKSLSTEAWRRAS